MAEVERVGSKTITETGEFAMTPRRRRHSKTNPPLHGIDTPALPLRFAPGTVVAGGAREERLAMTIGEYHGKEK